MDSSDRSGWSAFELAVAEVLDRLGPGDLVTYGEVAAEAGYPGAARAVGNMLRRSGERGDSAFCWWRVIPASGRPAEHIGAEQVRRLQAEGIEVRDGRVRLSAAARR